VWGGGQGTDARFQSQNLRALLVSPDMKFKLLRLKIDEGWLKLRGCVRVLQCVIACYSVGAPRAHCMTGKTQ